MMLYKNTKGMVCSLDDDDINFFDFISEVLQGDKLTPYIFIICLDYQFRASIDLIKENGFTLKKIRRKSYPTGTMADADNADDLAFFANTPTQTEPLLHSLE